MKLKPSLLTSLQTQFLQQKVSSFSTCHYCSSRDSPGSGRRNTDCQESRLETEIVTGHTINCPLLTSSLPYYLILLSCKKIMHKSSLQSFWNRMYCIDMVFDSSRIWSTKLYLFYKQHEIQNLKIHKFTNPSFKAGTVHWRSHHLVF